MSMSFRERKACNAMKVAMEFVQSLQRKNIEGLPEQSKVLAQFDEALDDYFGSDRGIA
jgi:hypothetical protein